ncbi:MAG TPA: protein phosphatase 2C domain-containing protein [Vicinamibacterales bacterium]|nr:protein phosphatase 2C domain-containing protein [Vicinamibacterales bacterium]
MSPVQASSIDQANGRVLVHSAGGSDSGRVRENNEDRFHCDSERGIYIVVDGVGGHAGGETAAETALLQVRTRLEREAGSAEERLREAITLANNEVYRLSRTNAEWTGMACVLTAAIVEDHQVTIGHVGDSRLYKLRGGTIEKLTHDHSPVGEREDAGELDELDAMRHPRRNEVFRDVGSDRHTPADVDFVEIVTAPFEADAALILCSDGLSDLVTSREMLAIASRHAGRPEAVVHELIAEANRAGGKDNVTAVYVEGPAFPRGAATTAARGGRGRALTHLGAFLIGVAVGAAAMSFVPDTLRALLPGAPVTAVTPDARAPRVLLVQQAAAAEFATISDALASADPGDTVIVGPGEYREQLRLPSGVTVTSELPHRAVISPPDGAVAAPAVTADGVRGARLRGFQIRGGDQGQMPIGVMVLNGELELQDTRINGATDAGVDVWGGTAVTLRANDISDNPGIGVRVRSGAQPSLLHNTIVRNGRGQPAAPGVWLDAGAAPLLVGNVIADNGAEGVAGVAARDRAALLSNNVFVADARPNARGALRVVGETAPARR